MGSDDGSLSRDCSLVCSITSNPVGELCGSGFVMVYSFMSGFTCTDVVKVRLMNDSGRIYKGVPDCVRTIVTREGSLAFYKGFGMCWARVSNKESFRQRNMTHLCVFLSWGCIPS